MHSFPVLFSILRHRRAGLALSLLLATTAVCADAALQTALDAYWLRHPQAQALNARLDAADAAQSQANGFLAGAPTVALSRLDERDGAGRETEFELALPLARHRDARQRSAGAERQAIAAEAHWLRLSLAAELLRVDSERQQRDEALKLSKQRLQLAQALEQNVQQKVAAGELARADALLAQSETLAADAALLQAEQAADEARSAWQLRAGKAAGLPAAPDTTLIPVEGLIEQHPQLLQALAKAQAATARVQFQHEHAGNTELSLLMRREEDPLLDQRIDSAGLRFSMPISFGSNRRINTATAEAERFAAEAEAHQLREYLLQEQQQARRHYQRAGQQQTLAAQQLQLTEQSWQFAQAAFSAGELALSELLRQQQRLFDSHENLSQQQQQQRDALARLILAEGVLP